MAENRKTIPLANLYLDSDNPRVEEDSRDQRVMMRALAQEQGPKLIHLARSIVELGGLDPSALPMVIEREGVPGGYWVLEGNRRIFALKLLDHPDLGEGLVDPPHLKTLKKIAGDVEDGAFANVPCVVFNSREEARPWIKLRHTGENKGAGTVPWNAEQSARWDAGDGPPPPHIQAIDYVRTHGQKPAKEAASQASVTNVKRLLDDPYVRGQLGIDQSKGRLTSGLPRQELVKALGAIVRIAAAHKVKDIYTRAQRRAKVDELTAAERPDLSKVAGARPIDPKDSGPSTPRRRPRRKARRERKELIPNDCVLRIVDDRCNDVHHELRSLRVDDHTNAVAVMFRVFLELSVDHLISRESIGLPSHPTLKNKLQLVEDFLIKAGRMTSDQMKPVRTIRQSSKHFLGVSIDSMHDWVHSADWSPIPGDLLAGWDNLQKFFEAIWAESP